MQMKEAKSSLEDKPWLSRMTFKKFLPMLDKPRKLVHSLYLDLDNLSMGTIRFKMEDLGHK